MNAPLLKSNALIWLGLLALAFANGALREVVIKRWVQEPLAHQLSVGTAVVMFSAYVWALWPRTYIQTGSQAAIVGLGWFFMTACFETFVLNRWVSGLSWQQIGQSYDVAKGEFWPLVLVWVGLLPTLVLWMRGPAS